MKTKKEKEEKIKDLYYLYQRDYDAKVRELKNAPRFREYIRLLLEHKDDKDWDPRDMKEYQKKYKVKNKDKINEYQKEYRKKNKDK